MNDKVHPGVRCTYLRRVSDTATPVRDVSLNKEGRPQSESNCDLAGRSLPEPLPTKHQRLSQTLRAPWVVGKLGCGAKITNNDGTEVCSTG